MAKKIYVGGRIENREVGGIVTGAAEVFDDAKGKKQSVINQETDTELERLDQSKQDNLTFDNAPTEGSNNPVKSGGVYMNEALLRASIEAILLLIPSAATELNKLADKAFVNSSIATSTATFRGTFTDLQELLAAPGDANDYAYLQTTDASGNSVFDRYKYVDGTGWVYEYKLNNNAFTAEEWAAIKSGITAALVAKLAGLPTSSELQVLLGQKQDVLTFDNIPVSGSANPVKSGGVYSAINDEKMARENLEQTVTDIDGRVGDIEEVIPTGAAANNKLVANNSMEAYVASIIDAITASFTIATADGHINLTLTQTNGRVASLTLISSDIASALALTALTGRVSTAEGNITTINSDITSLGGRVSMSETDIANLQQLYNNLQQSKPVPVTALPETGQQQGVIYRLAGTTSYSDYMWNGSTWVQMAIYNNAIDARPKKNSQNLVASGGVFDNMGALDVSELNATENPHTLAKYADLSSAIAAIPTDYQKGGMSIKFIQGTVQSSDNKYVQYRLMSDTFNTIKSNWQGVDDEPINGSNNLVESGGIQKKDWFYYVYGTGTSFSNTSIHIKTLGIFKKNNSVWGTIEVDETFTLNDNRNIVLRKDGTIVYAVSNDVVSSDVILLIHDRSLNDWIGGVLYSQYLSEKIKNERVNTNIYTLTGVTFGEHFVSFNDGKVWWISQYDNQWHSSNQITSIFDFSSDDSTGFLVLDTVNNTVTKRVDSSFILTTDVILLQHTVMNDSSENGFTAGKVYGQYLDYVNNILDAKINEVTDVIKVKNIIPYSVVSKHYIKSDGTIGDAINGFYTSPILLKAGQKIRFSVRGSSCAAMSAYDNGTYTPIFTIPSAATITISNEYLAENDTYVVFSGDEDSLRLYTAEPLDYIKNEVIKLKENQDGYYFIDVQTLTKLSGSIVNATGLYISGGYGALIHLDEFEFVDIELTTQANKPMVYSLLKDNVFVNGQVVNYASGYTHNIVTGNDVTVKPLIPSDAHYLWLLYEASDNINYLPSLIKFFKKPQFVSFEEQSVSDEKKAIARRNIGAISESEINIENQLSLRQGAYNASLVFDKSNNKSVSTNLIKGGKLIEVNTPYRIKTAVLVNKDSIVQDVSNNILLESGVGYNFPAYETRTLWGIDNVSDEYHIVVSFCRSDGGDIHPTDDIIKNIYDINSDDLHPILRDDFYVGNAVKRSNQVQNIVYENRAALPIITNYYNNAYKEVSVGAKMVGLPYSSVKELDKLVPYNVSFKTFMTALHNKRSLLYTEIVSSAHSRSSYGFTYHGTGCASYYGIACNWNTAYVLGLKIPMNSFETIAVAGMSLVYNSASGNEFDIQNLKPLDILYRSGHISIVSNVYRDNYGKVLIIAWSEANISYARTSLYNKEMFLDRIHHGDYDHREENGYKIYRYSYPDNNQWTDEYKRSEFTKGGFEEFLNEYKYNDDICTFAGDAAKFIEGEKIVLNINKGDYTSCQLYKDDVLLNTIVLSDNEEIDLDLSSYNLTNGSYKARLTDGTNYSDYTYFEVYDISLSVDSSKRVSFSCSRLTPLYFEFQPISGTFDGRVELSSSDIENGYKDMTKEFSASKYIKLFAKADDGYVVTKRIIYNV